MLKFTLFTIVLFLSLGNSFCALAQNLDGSFWKIETVEEVAYIQFNGDIMSEASPDIQSPETSIKDLFYDELLEYKVSEDTIFLNWLPANILDPNNTGIYIFKIEDDTLRFFTEIDSCDTRRNLFETLDFVRIECTTSNNIIKIKKQLKVYPNPSSNGIFYYEKEEVDNIDNFRFLLSDVEGKILNTGLFDGSGTIDLSEYPYGIYLMKIINEHNEFQVMRLLKQ